LTRQSILFARKWMRGSSPRMTPRGGFNAREIAMRGLICGLLLVPALTSWAAVAQDADSKSTKSILPHCVAGLASDTQDVTGGRCAGIIATLSFVSRVLPDNLKFCHPNTATPEQMMQVVASFVEVNPDSVAQDFRLVALAAMRDKWPCEE
jgi:Rap1a immunity proteins